MSRPRRRCSAIRRCRANVRSSRSDISRERARCLCKSASWKSGSPRSSGRNKHNLFNRPVLLQGRRRDGGCGERGDRTGCRQGPQQARPVADVRCARKPRPGIPGRAGTHLRDRREIQHRDSVQRQYRFRFQDGRRTSARRRGPRRQEDGVGVNRIVITGLGTVSPVGLSTESYWTALKAGQSGFGSPTIFDAERLNTRVVAEVKGFVPDDHFDARQIGFLDRVSQFAVVAAREAITQSGLSFRDGLGERTAAIVGSGIGGQTTQDEAFKRIYGENAPRVHPLIIPRTMPNAPASQISMFFGIKGPTYAISTACASATHAIGQAFHLVRAGGAACAVAGGAEAQLTHGTVKAWEAMRILAPDTCRPFSREN